MKEELIKSIVAELETESEIFLDFIKRLIVSFKKHRRKNERITDI